MPEASALSNAESKGINVSKTYKPKFSRAALACCAAFCCLKSTFTITTAWLTFKLLNKLASSTVNSTDLAFAVVGKITKSEPYAKCLSSSWSLLACPSVITISDDLDALAAELTGKTGNGRLPLYAYANADLFLSASTMQTCLPS